MTALHHCGTPLLVVNDACGRPHERCPKCRPRSSRSVDHTHPSLSQGRSQVVEIVAPRFVPPPEPERVLAIDEDPLPEVPKAYSLTRVPGFDYTYILKKVGTHLRTSFACPPWRLEETVERELWLLKRAESGWVAPEDEDDDDDEPIAQLTPSGQARTIIRVGPMAAALERKKPPVHPGLLPSDHPRAIAWRRAIQDGVNRANARREGKSA